jgi:uncharacterized delta-60 repeat protein
MRRSSGRTLVVFILAAALVAASNAPARAADGGLDKTFNKTGKAKLAFLPNAGEIPGGVAVQPDGKIVAGGILQQAPAVLGDFALARFLPGGTLDPTFGTNGKVTTSFGSGFGAGADYLRDLALQKDGKIVAVGPVSAEIVAALTDFGVARYLTNGQLDPAFGTGGKVRHDVDLLDDAQEVVLQADGKIVVVGWGTGFDGQTSLLVARFLANGDPDPAFGEGGHARFRPEGLAALGFGVALQKNGRIVAAGYAMTPAGNQPFLARFMPNGAVDLSFSQDGAVVFREPTPGGFAQVAVAADGKILAAGERQRQPPRQDTDLVVHRLLPTGAPDRAFGQSGKTFIDFFAKNDLGGGVVLTPTGKIVVGGQAVGLNGSALSQLALARLNPNGSLDPTFGAGGKQVFALTNQTSGAGDVALQKDGKIVVLSGTGNDLAASGLDMMLSRHLAK